MAASNGGPGGGPISAEARAALGEGIGLVFRRWTALQMAVENQWGGRESRAKADQLGASVLSWFCNSRGPHYFEDLVEMMDASISEWFNADVEDGSIEEVAQELLIMHEECLQSNYSSIERLRNSQVQGSAVSQSRQIAGDDDGDSDSLDDDDDASMMDDEAAARQRRWRWTEQGPPIPSQMQMVGLLCLLGEVEAGIKLPILLPKGFSSVEVRVLLPPVFFSGLSGDLSMQHVTLTLATRLVLWLIVKVFGHSDYKSNL